MKCQDSSGCVDPQEKIFGSTGFKRTDFQCLPSLLGKFLIRLGEVWFSVLERTVNYTSGGGVYLGSVILFETWKSI